MMIVMMITMATMIHDHPDDHADHYDHDDHDHDDDDDDDDDDHDDHHHHDDHDDHDETVWFWSEEKPSKHSIPRKRKQKKSKSKGKSHHVQNLSHAHASSVLETQMEPLNDMSRTGQRELSTLSLHVTALKRDLTPPGY